MLRASYEVITRDVLRLSGRAGERCWSGRANSSLLCCHTLGADRSGIATSSSARSLQAAMPATFPVLGGLDEVPRVLREHDVHELILDRRRLHRARAARARRGRAPSRREGQDRAPDDGAARPACRVHPRRRGAAVRAPPARTRRVGVGGEARASTSSSSSFVIVVGLPLWLPSPVRSSSTRAGRCST